MLRVRSHFPFCVVNVPAPPSAIGFLCVPVLQRGFLSSLTAGTLMDCCYCCLVLGTEVFSVLLVENHGVMEKHD